MIAAMGRRSSTSRRSRAANSRVSDTSSWRRFHSPVSGSRIAASATSAWRAMLAIASAICEAMSGRVSSSSGLNGRARSWRVIANAPGRLAIVDQGDRGRDDGVGRPRAAHRRWEGVATQGLVDDQPALGDRPARGALAGWDPDTEIPLVAADLAHQPVLAGRGVAEHQPDGVDPQDPLDRADDRLVGRRRVQARVDLGPEGHEAPEELRSIREGLSLAGERQRRGDPVADDDHRVAVALVERGLAVALDVEDAEEGVAHEERDAHLASDLGIGGGVVRVGPDVGHEGGAPLAHDPADDARAAVECLDRRVVAALGAEPQDLAIDRVDRDVAVAEPRDQHVHRPVERDARRPVDRQGAPDLFDGGHLAGPAAMGRRAASQVIERPLERADRASGADRQDGRRGQEGGAALQHLGVDRGPRQHRQHERDASPRRRGRPAPWRPSRLPSSRSARTARPAGTCPARR